MRKFKPSKAFKRDIGKIGISEPLVEVLYLLNNDQSLPAIEQKKLSFL